MGGTGKNIRNKRKIKESLQIIHIPFTSQDMATITHMSLYTCVNLLKQFDCLVNNRDPVTRNIVGWRFRDE